MGYEWGIFHHTVYWALFEHEVTPEIGNLSILNINFWGENDVFASTRDASLLGMFIPRPRSSAWRRMSSQLLGDPGDAKSGGSEPFGWMSTMVKHEKPW